MDGVVRMRFQPRQGGNPTDRPYSDTGRLPANLIFLRPPIVPARCVESGKGMYQCRRIGLCRCERMTNWAKGLAARHTTGFYPNEQALCWTEAAPGAKESLAVRHPEQGSHGGTSSLLASGRSPNSNVRSGLCIWRLWIRGRPQNVVAPPQGVCSPHRNQYGRARTVRPRAVRANGPPFWLFHARYGCCTDGGIAPNGRGTPTDDSTTTFHIRSIQATVLFGVVPVGLRERGQPRTGSAKIQWLHTHVAGCPSSATRLRMFHVKHDNRPRPCAEDPGRTEQGLPNFQSWRCGVCRCFPYPREYVSRETPANNNKHSSRPSAARPGCALLGTASWEQQPEIQSRVTIELTFRLR